MSSPLVCTQVFDQTADAVALDKEVMTVGGTVRAMAALLVVMATVGAVGWAVTDVGQPSDVSPTPLVCVASIGAFGLAIWAWVRPRRSAVLAPLYAAAQGLALGSTSHRYDAVSEGVVVQAIAGTLATLSAMILLYRCGAIRATDRLRARVLAGLDVARAHPWSPNSSPLRQIR